MPTRISEDHLIYLPNVGRGEVSPIRRRLYMFNHIEYNSATPASEYFRDLEAGGPIAMPDDYFPDDDPTRAPVNRWRSHDFRLFGNWINQDYQPVPIELPSPQCG